METFTEKDLLTFKKAQRLAYNCVLAVEQRLYEGITEIQAAEMIDSYLKDQEVTHFFHHGFAWFGDRTRFKNFTPPFKLNNLDDLQDIADKIISPGLPHFGKQFAPTEKKLEKSMAVILDVAPCIDSCAADVGYSFSFGENKAVDRARQDLKIIRETILSEILAEKTGSDIYLKLNMMLKEMKYDNIHSMYPGEVLAHKVGKIPLQGLPPLNILGFDWQSFVYLGLQKISASKSLEDLLFDTSPLWGPDYSKRVEPGLWAIEPHIGRADFGVKFEEIMVVTENNAYWLDDQVPHVLFQFEK